MRLSPLFRGLRPALLSSDLLLGLSSELIIPCGSYRRAPLDSCSISLPTGTVPSAGGGLCALRMGDLVARTPMASKPPLPTVVSGACLPLSEHKKEMRNPYASLKDILYLLIRPPLLCKAVYICAALVKRNYRVGILIPGVAHLILAERLGSAGGSAGSA